MPATAPPAAASFATALIGLFGDGPHDLHWWADRGWTADMLTEVTRLTDWALEHRTYLGTSRERPYVANHLIGVWEILDGRDECPNGSRWDDLPAEHAAPWVALVTTAPTARAWARLHNTITMDRSTDLAAFTRWRTLGAGGALAYAAGLNVDEAAALLPPYTRSAVSTPGAPAVLPPGEEERLRTLAALRGYVLPEHE